MKQSDKTTDNVPPMETPSICLQSSSFMLNVQSVVIFNKSFLKHSHKKRKDSLETRAELAVFSL